MIHGEKRLPDNILARVSDIASLVSKDQNILALFLFGSGARNNLQSLSDLDFAILLSKRLNKRQRFDEQIEWIGRFNRFFGTDEIDLVVLNDAPPRISFRILKEGRLLFVKDKKAIVDFREQLINRYLDFKYFRDDFDRTFLEGIGYHGSTNRGTS